MEVFWLTTIHLNFNSSFPSQKADESVILFLITLYNLNNRKVSQELASSIAVSINSHSFENYRTNDFMFKILNEMVEKII